MNPMIMGRNSPVVAAGEGKGAWLAALELGAEVLQDTAPLRGFDVYVVGFHCARDEAEEQMEAHHYCRVVNDDMLQCVIFDGNTRDANLVGIEYIVSAPLFDTLAEDERAYWHPHNFEILSGQLAAPGLPEPAERALMKQLMNSYGKTWHTWHTGRHDGLPGFAMPEGEPKLMWSFNRQGECDDSLIADRDRALGTDTMRKWYERQQNLLELARPQHGVDTMKDQFTDTSSMLGVVDVNAPDARS